MYVIPTIAEFKAYFVRDFPYGTDPATSILDSDIQKAIITAQLSSNESLFYDQNFYQNCMYYLIAHYMVVSLQTSANGISGQFDWLVNSKSVGSVSEGLAIPQRILDNPEFSWLTRTPYGAQYLAMVLPYLSGQVFITYGRTTP